MSNMIHEAAGTVYSLSELEAHAKKAVRGAGFAWGYAEEAAKAVRLLAAHQLPGAVVLATYLAERAENSGDAFAGPVVDDDWVAADALCPVLSGAVLCDYLYGEHRASTPLSPRRKPLNRALSGAEWQNAKEGGGDTITLTDLAYPLLVLPYLLLLSRRLDCSFQINWEGVELACHQGRLVQVSVHEGALIVARAERFSCGLAAAADVGEEAGNRGQVIEDGAWQALNAFAYHTYVPATEASRRGAGPAD